MPDPAPFAFLTDPAARWNRDLPTTLDQRLFRVLTVEGDGVRAATAAQVLAELERRAGLPAASMFDAVVGSSTASLLALSTVVPNPLLPAEPCFLAEHFEEAASAALGGLPRDAMHLERVATEMFGDAMLSDALRLTLVPTYDLRRDMPVCLTSDAPLHAVPQAPDLPMALAARAAASIPVRYRSVTVESPPLDPVDPRPGHQFGPPFHLHGGGALTGHAGQWAPYAAGLKGEVRPLLLVSIGGGELERRLHADAIDDLKVTEWARGGGARVAQSAISRGHLLLDMELNVKWQDPHDRDPRGRGRVPGESQVRVRGEDAGRHFDGNAVHDARFGHRTRWTRYLRLQPTLGQVNADPFDRSFANRKAQRRDVARWIALRSNELTELADFLRTVAGLRPPRTTAECVHR